jgi:hypothetical protein
MEYIEYESGRKRQTTNDKYKRSATSKCVWRSCTCLLQTNHPAPRSKAIKVIPVYYKLTFEWKTVYTPLNHDIDVLEYMKLIREKNIERTHYIKGPKHLLRE